MELYDEIKFLPLATKLGKGNILRSMCQEFCPQGGACMVSRGTHVWLLGGHVWLPGRHAWLPGGMCGCWGHAWLQGGMHGCWGGGMCGCWGACIVGDGVCMVVGGRHRIRQDTVNEWAVRILLECILLLVISG